VARSKTLLPYVKTNLREIQLFLVYEGVPVFLFVQERPQASMGFLQLRQSLCCITLQLPGQVLQPYQALGPRVLLLLLLLLTQL
jgi:hypothetical protein